jgi:hypothetical protein
MYTYGPYGRMYEPRNYFCLKKCTMTFLSSISLRVAGRERLCLYSVLGRMFLGLLDPLVRDSDLDLDLDPPDLDPLLFPLWC